MLKFSRSLVLLLLGAIVLAAGFSYLLPPVQRRLSWRADLAFTYFRALANPAGALPTTLPQPQIAITHQPLAQQSQLLAQETSIPPTVGPTPTPTLLPTPLPKSITLAAPKWEKQDANNCGPASLALYLRHYGWEGDQFTISEIIKPFREDRNVNVDELVYYVRNKAGWLNIEFRVGGDLETLKKLLAAGLPVMIEEGTLLDQPYWPNDDRWAAHYLLLTAYDDNLGVFTGQDTYYGADKKIAYQDLDKAWQTFNRVYIMVYPPEQEDVIKSILGEHWDVDYNRQQALLVAQEETQSDPQNPYPWFNLGTNLVYFERYREASEAFDQARNLGLPQRMLRYQFGPFIAYFHTGQLDDLGALVDYALKITRNSEEVFLWRGWMFYRQGKTNQAIEEFRRALEANPFYEDARYALSFVGATP